MSETEITLGRDNPEAIEAFKLTSMSDAMRLAREASRTIEDPDPDPYGYGQDLEHEYGVNLLEPKWKAEPDDDRWNKRTKARARKAAVARFYLLGHKVSDIAKKVKVSEVTVYNDIKNIQLEWRKSYLDDIEILAAKDIAALDYMLQKLMPGIDRGDPKAVMAALSIIQERGNILGIRAGVQVDIEQQVREVAESAGYDPDKAVALAQKISITMR